MNLVELVENERNKLLEQANIRKDKIEVAHKELKGFSEVKLATPDNHRPNGGKDIIIGCTDSCVYFCYMNKRKEDVGYYFFPKIIEKEYPIRFISVTYDLMKEVYIVKNEAVCFSEECEELSQVKQKVAEILARLM
jgi:hypothetical protein